MELYKNLLTELEITYINKTLRGSHWGYGYTSSSSDKPIWNFDKEKSKPIAELIFSKLEGYTLDDWHINGQTRLMDGGVHQDHHEGSTHSFVFFTQGWEYLWGGRLHLCPVDASPIVITPEPNMGILFDSSIPHYAEGVAYTQTFLRTSIGLKLSKKI
mgnify:FL=1